MPRPAPPRDYTILAVIFGDKIKKKVKAKSDKKLSKHKKLRLC